MLKLLSLATPRTDSPAVLPPVAVNPHPLDCGDESESKDALLLRRSQLRLARRGGAQLNLDRDRTLGRSTQTGFLQVALLKALQNTPPPDRQQWIADYKAIRTHADAALFMVEATLKAKHGMDVRKIEREGAEAVVREKRRRKGV